MNFCLDLLGMKQNIALTSCLNQKSKRRYTSQHVIALTARIFKCNIKLQSRHLTFCCRNCIISCHKHWQKDWQRVKTDPQSALRVRVSEMRILRSIDFRQKEMNTCWLR